MRHWIVFLPLLFSVAGLGIATAGVATIRKARSSASWPSTEGRITHSDVVEKGDSEGGTNYAPEIRYSYRVDGREFTGTAIFVSGTMSYGDRQPAEKDCGRYPIGRPVSVYYDPKKPDSAMLEPGLSKKVFIPLATGLGFAVMGAWFCLMFWLFID